MGKMESNRTVYGRTLAELGGRDSRIVVLDADVPKSTNTYQFREKFPDRFFNVGVAEQNEMCIAAGLATAGKIPFVSTFATFASMRACDQVRQSLACPHLNVKVVATNAGIENNGDGVTHQAIEDMAIMRAMPGMVVLCPSDPVTTRLAVIKAYEYNGPVYMRLGRYENPVLHNEDVDFEIGRMIKLREGKDVTIIATGRMAEEALKAAEALAGEGIEARVLDCHTIKPIDREAILAAARETRGIVTAEDHNIMGGLGSAVCEVVAEEHPTVVKRVGVRDQFASSGRDWRALMAYFHVDAGEIVNKAQEIVG
jgi:transketolase